MRLLLGVQDVLDLGETVYQAGNLVPETLPQVLYGIVGVLHDVVQEGGRYGFVTQADVVHHNLRDGDGVEHVGLTAAAAHVLVCLVGKLEGPLDDFELGLAGAALRRRLTQLGVVPFNDFVILGCKL